MRRQIIGRRADRCCQQDAVADKLLDLVLAIDLHPDMRRIVRLAKKRDLVDRQRAVCGAVCSGHRHSQWMDRRRLGALDPLDKLIRGVMVHQKAKPPAIQPEDGPFMRQRFVKDMQHMAVATKRHNAVGGSDVGLPIAVDEPGQPFLCHLMGRS